MTQHRDRRIGLPRVTVEAIVATTPCPDCDAEVGRKCTVRNVRSARYGHRCDPHGLRIRAWHDLGMPTGVRR